MLPVDNSKQILGGMQNDLSLNFINNLYKILLIKIG